MKGLVWCRIFTSGHRLTGSLKLKGSQEFFRSNFTSCYSILFLLHDVLKEVEDDESGSCEEDDDFVLPPLPPIPPAYFANILTLKDLKLIDPAR